MTAEQLKSLTVKDLAQIAKQRGVAGWHAMRKDQLVKALLKVARAKKKSAASRRTPSRPAAAAKNTSRRSSPRNSTGRKNGANGHLKNGSAASRRPAPNGRKNLATGEGKPARRDRLVVMVRDAYWLHAHWELSRQSVARAEAALGQLWHSAHPVLRLSEVSPGEGTSFSEMHVRDIRIHGGVNNWYIDVKDPPKSYRVQIGYLASAGKFFSLARSNIVTTPRAGASDDIDRNWSDVAENFEKIYAMSGGGAMNGASEELDELFEERLRRPMSVPALAPYNGSDGNGRRLRDFNFEVDAELIVYGATEPGAQVTLSGDPVSVRPDGSFTVRFSLPNSRQVIPAVASSGDGVQERTIVLAVERNTKTMEPVVRDGHDV